MREGDGQAEGQPDCENVRLFVGRDAVNTLPSSNGGGMFTTVARHRAETRVAMRRYSDAECQAMLSDALADFAAPVLQRNPELKGRDAQLAAATSLAYNIGPQAYARSTVARRFTARDWRGACDAFLMWNRAGGRVVAGLTNRRKAERALCLKGLA